MTSWINDQTRLREALAENERLREALEYIASFFFAGWPDHGDQEAIRDAATNALQQTEEPHA